MKPVTLFFFLTILSLALWAGCTVVGGNSNTSNADIIVYGTTTCSVTTGLMSDMDERRIQHTFKDVEADASANTELLNKLLATDWYQGDTVAIPVVDVDGLLLERPTIEEIEALL